MSLKCAAVIVVAMVAMVLVTATAATPTPRALIGTLTQISGNFSWAENMHFDGQGGFWVSDDFAGTLYRLTRSTATGQVTKTAWLSGFKNLLGLASRNISNSSSSAPLIAVVEQSDKKKTMLVNVNTHQQQSYTPYASTSCLGNGLAVDAVTGVTYTCCEASFIPLLSKVEVATEPTPTSDDAATEFDKDLWCADGTYYYQLEDGSRLLFITLSAPGKVRIYNLSASETKAVLIKEYKAPLASTLDDMCVLPKSATDRTPIMYAADFLEGNILRFDAMTGNESTALKLATGFNHPTSVRLGVGIGWGSWNSSSMSLFISEGGPLPLDDSSAASGTAKHPFLNAAAAKRNFKESITTKNIKGASTRPDIAAVYQLDIPLYD